MEPKENQKKNQEILAKVIAETWESEEFKEELLHSPSSAIRRLTGGTLNLKDSTRMVVVDQSDSNTFYLNLPAKPDLEEIELTEEQLEVVAGGITPSEAWRKAKKAARIAAAIVDML